MPGVQDYGQRCRAAVQIHRGKSLRILAAENGEMNTDETRFFAAKRLPECHMHEQIKLETSYRTK